MTIFLDDPIHKIIWNSLKHPITYKYMNLHFCLVGFRVFFIMAILVT